MTIENTSERAAELHLLGTMAEGQSKYIENMEASGQKQLVASTSLPSELLDNGCDGEAKAMLVSWGFVFSDPDPSDPLFMPATLPPGWTKAGTDHDMWSDVLDDQGRKRIGVFYKAAFYDRKAHMRINARYREDYTSGATYDDDITIKVIDSKTGKELASFTGPHRETSDKGRDFLTAHQDDWRNPKHWDAE